MPPDLTSAELGEGQARGFQIATQAYIEDCVTEDCPLGDTPEAALKGLDDLFRQVDRQPLPTGDPSAPLLTEGWARLGVAVALYDQGAWGILTDALKEAKAGNGQSLMQLADAYADRRPGGGYDGNLMESIYAVNCLDRPDSPDLSAYETYAKDFSAKAPTWGANLAWGALPCGVWPVKSAVGPHTVTAPGSDPIVVVGTTRDPATIYEWSGGCATSSTTPCSCPTTVTATPPTVGATRASTAPSTPTTCRGACPRTDSSAERGPASRRPSGRTDGVCRPAALLPGARSRVPER